MFYICWYCIFTWDGRNMPTIWVKLLVCDTRQPSHTSALKNAVSAIQISLQTTFIYLGRFLKKLANDQSSSITKGSIYHVKHVYIQPCTTIVDWPEISTVFYICRYCIFPLWFRLSEIQLHMSQHASRFTCCLKWFKPGS